MSVLDLRSDTFTKPNDEMRQLMAAAPVGDDVFGEDPTVNKLQVMAAEISGKETALYVSSGTQSNLCAILAQCWERGAEIFVGDKSHIALYEQGNVSQFGGVLVRSVPNQADGSFDLAYLETLLHGVEDAHFPNARLICIEASHNMCGGTVPTLEWLGKCRAFASKHNLRIHLDAARGFNATAYHGITIEKLCSFADSVSICTSKGLGAPVGSVLCTDAATLKRAHRVRKALGGGMRQAGIIAAGSLHALSVMSKRIHIDNQHALEFAKVVAAYDCVEIDLSLVHTNIVRFKLKPPHSQADFITQLATPEIISIKCLEVSGGFIRLTFHCDAADEDAIKRGKEKLSNVLNQLK